MLLSEAEDTMLGRKVGPIMLLLMDFGERLVIGSSGSNRVNSLREKNFN